jgi:hypothetical protein
MSKIVRFINENNDIEEVGRALSIIHMQKLNH